MALTNANMSHILQMYKSIKKIIIIRLFSVYFLNLIRLVWSNAELTLPKLARAGLTSASDITAFVVSCYSSNTFTPETSKHPSMVPKSRH